MRIYGQICIVLFFVDFQDTGWFKNTTWLQLKHQETLILESVSSKDLLNNKSIGAQVWSQIIQSRMLEKRSLIRSCGGTYTRRNKCRDVIQNCVRDYVIS